MAVPQSWAQSPFPWAALHVSARLRASMRELPVMRDSGGASGGDGTGGPRCLGPAGAGRLACVPGALARYCKLDRPGGGLRGAGVVRRESRSTHPPRSSFLHSRSGGACVRGRTWSDSARSRPRRTPPRVGQPKLHTGCILLAQESADGSGGRDLGAWRHMKARRRIGGGAHHCLPAPATSRSLRDGPTRRGPRDMGPH